MTSTPGQEGGERRMLKPSEMPEPDTLVDYGASGVMAATDSMCGYAKHRHPEISREQARGIWFTMVDQALADAGAPA